MRTRIVRAALAAAVLTGASLGMASPATAAPAPVKLGARWSHASGNRVVPSDWQATAITLARSRSDGYLSFD